MSETKKTSSGPQTATIVAVVGAALFGLFLLSAGGEADKKRELEDMTKAVEELAKNGPHTNVTMFELDEAYKRNPVSADVLYKGAALRVSGMVSSIVQERDGTVVYFGPETYDRLAGCVWGSNEISLVGLRVGGGVTVKGVGVGKISGTPMMAGCDTE